MAAASSCLKWRPLPPLGTAALPGSPAAAKAALSVADGRESRKKLLDALGFLWSLAEATTGGQDRREGGLWPEASPEVAVCRQHL